MKLFGLTGGMGMGKSAAAQILRERGVPVVDTDDVAREVVAPGQPALAQVVQRFGQAILASDGSLRRSELARLVFADPAARKDLEAILHPAIRARWQAQVAAWRQPSHATAVVVIPLLFETGAEAEVDATICVACSTATQYERLLQRGWPREQIDQRVRAQLSSDQKVARANYVIWTEGSLEVHAAQLAKVVVPG